MYRVWAVTSDSAQCCRNARDALTTTYPRLVGVRDQAQVSNLCMQDIGIIPWIKSAPDAVAAITTETKQKMKLHSRLLRLSRIKYGCCADCSAAGAENVFPPLPLTAVTL